MKEVTCNVNNFKIQLLCIDYSLMVIILALVKLQFVQDKICSSSLATVGGS